MPPSPQNFTSSEFPSLSSIPSSHLSSPSRIKSPSPKPSTPQIPVKDTHNDSLNPSLHSLQCEIQLWQAAYQDAQETHATRIKQLIQEQKKRETDMRDEIREKWERRFEEIQRDTDVIEREMRWMVDVMLGRKDDEGSRLGTSRPDASFSESLNGILKDLIQMLSGHHTMQKISTTSSTTSHLMNDFKTRFHALLKNIQQQYEQLHTQNTRLTELNHEQQRTIKRQEKQIEELSDSGESHHHKMLQLQQEKAQFDLQLAQQRQLMENLRAENARLDSQLRQHFEETSSSTTELQTRIRELERERDEYQSDLQDLQLQFANKTRTLDNTEQKLHDTFEKLKLEQNTNTELSDKIFDLENEIRKLHSIEERFKNVQHQLQEESEERTSSQQVIEALNDEIHTLNTKHAQVERKLQQELDEYKRQAYESQQLLEASRADSKRFHARNTQCQEQMELLESTYEKKIALLQKQLDSTMSEMDQLRERTTEQIASEYQGVISRLTGIISTHNQQVARENAGDAITQVASIFDDYERRIAEIQEKSLVMEAGFKSRELKYEHKISELEFKVREKQAQMDDLKHDIEAAIEKMESKISNDAKIRGEERQRYKTVISVLQQQIENSGLPKSSGVAAALASPKKGTKGDDNALRRKYKRIIVKLQREKQELELAVDKSENAVKSAKTRIALLQEQNEQLQQQLHKAHERCDSLDQQLRININKDAKDIEELIQQNVALKQELDDLRTQLQQNGTVMAAPDDSAEQLQQQLNDLSKKYRHIKDRYIRQSLRQNELQNYILNLHRTGRAPLGPQGVKGVMGDGRSSLGSFGSPPHDTPLTARVNAPQIYSAQSSQSTSPGKRFPHNGEEILTDESSFEEEAPRQIKYARRTPRRSSSTPRRRASVTPGEGGNFSAKRSSSSKKVSAPTLRSRPQSASSSRASSVPRKRGASSRY